MASLSSYLFSTLSKVGGIGGSGIPDFHYTIGDKVEGFAGKSIWDVHNSTKANDVKQEATVFVFAKARGASYTAVAQNTLRRMRTLRHPGILRYLDGAETPEAVYIATEPVTPLSLALDVDNSDELKRWGLYKIAETMRFINDDCKLIHANLSAASVFVTKAGEWRLGGLELVDSSSPAAASAQQHAQQLVYRHYTSVVPGYSARMAPEFAGQKWDAVEKARSGSVDGWYLGCLVCEVYNGELRAASQLQTQGQIPAPLWTLCQRLLAPDLRRRMAPSEFLQTASRSGGFLDSEFVQTSIFLENIAVKEEDEKAEFFSGLDSAIPGFPQAFSKYKILPELLKLMEFGGGDAKVLSGIIHIGRALDEQEYNDLVTPAIVQLFSSNDRTLRFSLLEYMDSFIQAIPSAVVSKRVFPNFVTGFLDAAPAIREATVKASLAMAPKLGQKTLNADLVKQLVRLVADPEPGIRTNALICIGKLCTAKEGVLDLDGDGVSESSHRYVICPALLQALRDPFPPVRSASLAVSAACASKWEAPEIARRVIPCLSPLLIDGEKPVRAAALRCLNAMTSRVESYAQGMPDTVAKKTAAVPATASSAAIATTGGTGVGQASGGSAQAEVAASMAASDTWGGWAVSSLSSTFSGALSLASSTIPIGQQQQQRPQTAPSTEGHELEKSEPLSSPASLQTFSSAAAGSAKQVKHATGMAAPRIAPAARAVSGSVAAGANSGGWEFNDDEWGNDADNGYDDDEEDAWGNGKDEDAWDVPANAPVPVAPSNSSLTGGSRSGGVTMANARPALQPAASPGSSNAPPTAKSSGAAGKTSLKLSRVASASAAANNRVSASGEPSVTTAGSVGTTANSTGPRRKGLGAMKLGGGAAKSTLPNLDDFF
ncbi:Nuclear aminoacylation-dependent tRNA export pathway component [Coemansia thaxteri]|uniref:Nuclear aminoacylation-dependent tRNA export pathway component n=1 Tax=Coemansia thaxteri TaxID=2663907 RepID=A0A9W8BNH0_9FUNG|nr:Nuclear aminoacylation-dependent tRNA export pathway component [Coemansia thaxteri]